MNAECTVILQKQRKNKIYRMQTNENHRETNSKRLVLKNNRRKKEND